MIFRNGSTVRDNEKWYFNDILLDIVNEFNYLGILMCYNGKFLKTQKHVADQGRKALFAINNSLKNHCFNVETKCSVFDMYVGSVLAYGSEIWGFHKAPDVEKVHINFGKDVLGVNRKTCNNMVYCEIGRLPLYVKRKLKIFKYWVKLENTDNCILKACYEDMSTYSNIWLNNIKVELSNLGLNYLYNHSRNQDTYRIIKNRLIDIYRQNIMASIENSAKCSMYRHLVDNFCIQYYLTKPLDTYCKQLITRYRTSSHSLYIERGRHNNVPRNMRICNHCSLNDIEDEFHFILKCPLYKDIRKRYIKQFYHVKPNVFKLIKLLSVNNVSELSNLGNYLKYATQLRKESVVI